MKFFLDTACLKEVKEAVDSYGIDGVTTNPTLLAKEKGTPLKILREICELVSGPVSFEVLRLDAAGMLEEARQLVKVAPNVVIKVPLTQPGLQAISILAQEGIKTNATLVFSVNQALLAARAGASYVSLFVGRLEDVGVPASSILQDTLKMLHHYNFKTELIVASIRNPWQVEVAARLRASICTVPYSVVTKLAFHPLTVKGLQQFAEDWKKVTKA